MARKAQPLEAKYHKAALLYKYLKLSPSLAVSLPNAMTASNFSITESEDPALQKRVQRIAARTETHEAASEAICIAAQQVSTRGCTDASPSKSPSVSSSSDSSNEDGKKRKSANVSNSWNQENPSFPKAGHAASYKPDDRRSTQGQVLQACVSPVRRREEHSNRKKRSHKC